MSYDYYDRDWTITNKAYMRKRSKPGVHVPNKLEAKVLRKLMSETGMSEAELRDIPKYRKELSEAQKPKPAEKPYVRAYRGKSKPKWKGSKPSDDNDLVPGIVIRELNTPITEGDSTATSHVWIIKEAKYTQKIINDNMYMEYWELSLENFLDPSRTKDKQDSRDIKGRYEIIPFEKIEKWKLKQMSKKFGL